MSVVVGGYVAIVDGCGYGESGRVLGGCHAPEDPTVDAFVSAGVAGLCLVRTGVLTGGPSGTAVEVECGFSPLISASADTMFCRE